MGRRYATLEGKEVDFTKWNGKTVKAKVTGSDWAIGLTLQEVGTEAYLVCLHGRKSPYIKDVKHDRELFAQSMAYVYDTIKASGTLKTQKFLDIFLAHGLFGGSGPSAETCAFSQ